MENIQTYTLEVLFYPQHLSNLNLQQFSRSHLITHHIITYIIAYMHNISETTLLV